jgi:hypothetical protein
MGCCMKKTVLILGAGASVDYGYPLWSELKNQMLALDVANVCKTLELSPEETKSHLDAFEEFKTKSKVDANVTLDQIVYEIDRPKCKHLRPNGHLLINLAGYCLAGVELKKIVPDIDWIAQLQDKLVEYLAQKSSNGTFNENHLNNLTVVSLNYDRVFPHRISEGFFEKLVLQSSYNPIDLSFSINFARNNTLSILRPHGYLAGVNDSNSLNEVGMYKHLVILGSHTQGTRYPGNEMPIFYGNPKIAEKKSFLRMGRHMYVVDERGDNDYASANKVIKSAEQIICLGLSKAGLSQSKLEFGLSKRVYLSNTCSDIIGIKENKPADYETLCSNGEMLKAAEFPDKFSALVLS